jgi:hypothetical protein
MKRVMVFAAFAALLGAGCVNGKSAVEKAADIEIRDAGVATGGVGATYVGPGEVYSNKHVPPRFFAAAARAYRQN